MSTIRVKCSEPNIKPVPNDCKEKPDARAHYFISSQKKGMLQAVVFRAAVLKAVLLRPGRRHRLWRQLEGVNWFQRRVFMDLKFADLYLVRQSLRCGARWGRRGILWLRRGVYIITAFAVHVMHSTVWWAMYIRRRQVWMLHKWHMHSDAAWNRRPSAVFGMLLIHWRGEVWVHGR